MVYEPMKFAAGDRETEALRSFISVRRSYADTALAASTTPKPGMVLLSTANLLEIMALASQ